MQREPRLYLQHVREACDRVEELRRPGLTFEGYLADDQLRWAIERQLTILGEAIYQLQAFFPEAAARIPDARLIIKFRHVLIHGYATVSDDVVWGIIEDDIPDPRRKVDELLNQ